MAPRHGKEFRTEAIRLALTSGLTRKQVAEDLGIGFSTLNHWVQKDQDNALMSGPHADLETENKGAEKLRGDFPAAKYLLANKGYDADWFRDGLLEKGLRPAFPPRRTGNARSHMI